MRFPLGPGPYRDRLLDAMASLLVDLHRAGVFWGDCSLANTLFRRDGDRIQAYLVDAETSEIHPTLSDGQRAYDLDILVENVGFGLADLGAMQGRDGRVRRRRRGGRDRSATRYAALWEELHLEPELLARRPARDPRPDPPAQRARLRGRRDQPRADVAGGEAVRLRVAVAEPPVPRPRAGAPDRARRARGPGAAPAQRPARVPGLARVIERRHGRPSEEAARALAARRPRAEPRAILAPAIGPQRDPLQAYCDVLEQKWLLSRGGRPRRRPRRPRSTAYLALGRPGARGRPGPTATRRPRHRLVRRARQPGA